MRTSFRNSTRPTRPSRLVLALGVLLVLVSTVPAGATLQLDDFFLPAGDNPQSLSATDCDGNGAPDLVVANFGAATVTIYPNLGGGVFGVARTVATAPSPAGAACADLTGDGIFDLVVSSFTAKTITVFQGEEAGGFTEIGVYLVGGAGPRTVSIADFDGIDGLDIAVVNSQSDNVAFFFGHGTGTFDGPLTLNLEGLGSSNPPVAGFAGNFAEAATPDLAIVSQGRPSLHLLLDGGAGLSAETMPELPRSRGVGGADVNDDGLLDLAVLSTESVVRILLGTGTGTFVVDETILVHPSARGVALADFDGDGLVDLAVAYNENNTIQIIPATGQGRFPTIAAAAADAHNPLGLLAGRTTDGSDQLILANPDTLGVTLLAADADGVVVPTFLQSMLNLPRAMILADMNGDTVLDAITVVKIGREVSFEILPGTADSAFAGALAGPDDCGDGVARGAELCDDGNDKRRDGCSRTCQPEIARGVRSLQAADIDGDGDTDLVLVDFRSRIMLLLGDGALRFTDVITLAKVRPGTTAEVGDFDGNGAPDIAYLPSRGRDGAVAVLFNDGLGNLSKTAVVPKGRFRGPVLSGDVDGNGTLDLMLLTRARPKGIVSLLNDGAGPERISSARALPTTLASLAAGDFNEDGRLDLLAEFKSRRQLPLVIRGIGGGEFGAGTPAAAERFAGASIFDVDHDLHEDIVICDGDPGAPCRALYGDGTGLFHDTSSSPEDMIGTNLQSFVDADIDLDGVVDTVGVSRNDNRAVVLFGTAGSPAVTRVDLGPVSKPNAVAVGDVNNDGVPDIVVSNEGTHDLSRFMQGMTTTPLRGTRTFTGGGVRVATGGVRPLALALADLNGVPPLDVVVSLDIMDSAAPGGDSRPSGVALFRTQGSLLVPMVRVPTGKNPQALAVGLVNADGRPDIVTADLGSDTLTLLASTGVDAYTPSTLDSGGDGPSDVILADVVGDGALDLVAVNEASGTIVVRAGDGSGGFDAPIATTPLGRERPWNVCLGNFDGDADVDLAVASVKTADIIVLSGYGDGTWRDDGRVFTVGKDPHPLVCRDVDGDGISDVRFARRETGRIDTILSQP